MNTAKPTMTLLLEDPAGQPFHFAPGQFFTVDLRIGLRRVRRSYSASSVPGGRQLALTIKRTEGGRCSGHLNTKIRVGDRLDLHGPAGVFRIDPDPATARELVLVAGGSGITPMMSIAATVLATEPGTRVTLLYGNRRHEDVIFAAELDALAAAHPTRLSVRHVLQHAGDEWNGGRGVLDEATVTSELDALAPSPAARFFVCGPAPMMRAARAALLARGVARERIHEESFTPPTPTSVPKTAQPMTVLREGATLGTVTVAAGKTLLEAGRAKRLPLAYSCGAGNCGACILHLKDGEVTMAEPNCLTPEERALDCILACVARPLSPTTVEIP